MLCAIPGKSTNNLDLVRAVFRMIADQNGNVPTKLKDLVVDVIGEARDLTTDPSRKAALRHPESAVLALEMRNTQALARSLFEVTSSESLRPELATRVLSLMEVHPA